MNDSKTSPFFGLGERSIYAQNDTSWMEWDETKTFDKPTLLVLGGNRTRTPHEANGYIKLLQKALQAEQTKDIQVVGVYYDVPNKSSPFYITPYLRERQKFNYLDKRISKFEGVDIKNISAPPFPYAERLYDYYIQPLLVNKETQKSFSPTKSRKNMRNLNIVTHSFGDYFAVKLSEVMAQKMAELGYSEKNKKEIMKQVVVTTLGGPMIMGEKSNFTTLNVFSTRDAIVSFFHASTSWNRHLCDLFNENDTKGGTYIPFSKTESALMINRFYASSHEENEADEHGNVFFDIDNDKVTTAGANIKTLYRNFLQNALDNSIQNADNEEFIPLKPMDEMLRSPKGKSSLLTQQLHASFFLEEAKKLGKIDYANRIKLFKPQTETRFPLPINILKKLDSLKR